MKERFRRTNMFRIGVLCAVLLIGHLNLKAQSKVLIIGIDGIRPDALLTAYTPNLEGLWQNGAYSFKAKTDPLSWSGVCWTSMLTGVWKEKHKVYSNSYKNPNVEEYPYFFRRVREQRPNLQTYSIANWRSVHTILQENDAVETVNRNTDAGVTKEVVRTLKNIDVDVLFLHFDNVDHACVINMAISWKIRK
ncbi:alkaline phosphatase family protein [Antarcticibacterium sp. 1MA-6-2]|uniref:alkaline phosphatase family protein n=1 Tax=Antarcticibacterium sp. 1MA-6-2 TaxID=2908210 RepID=UPI001F2139D8|nr:alkaline phosphatase family protein [Antarcticibacterium sp. 1MA-6-2]UJH92686.1 alkaline phosphatase family protein [Antarcticibacterium sp. 1MA-6-2]